MERKLSKFGLQDLENNKMITGPEPLSKEGKE